MQKLPFQDKWPFTPADIRFTTKGPVLYAILLGWPADKTTMIKSLAGSAKRVSGVELLGAPGQLVYDQAAEGLRIYLPDNPPCKDAFVIKIKWENSKVPDHL